MKNEPVVTYNHMDEDRTAQYSTQEHEMRHYPVSLYLILAVDILLMGGFVFFICRILF